MQNIHLRSYGPIDEGSINISDLTLLIGGPASGKGIFLQLIKLLIDKDHISQTLEKYGYIWGDNVSEIKERYFGEGMTEIWRRETDMTLDSKKIDDQFLLNKEIPIKISFINLKGHISVRRISRSTGWGNL